MIAEKAAESIGKAVAYELQNIVKEHGAVYASLHEGYAVLLEEVEEAGEAQEELVSKLKDIWLEIREGHITSFNVHLLKEFAIALAEEAVQVAAVCERFQETVKNK